MVFNCAVTSSDMTSTQKWRTFVLVLLLILVIGGLVGCALWFMRNDRKEVQVLSRSNGFNITRGGTDAQEIIICKDSEDNFEKISPRDLRLATFVSCNGIQDCKPGADEVCPYVTISRIK